MKYIKSISVYVLVVLVILAAVRMFGSDTKEAKITELNYTQFYNKIEAGKFAEVTITAEENSWSVSAEDAKGKKYTAVLPSDDNSITLLQESGVKVNFKEAEGTPWWISMLPSLILAIIMIGFLMWIFNQSQGGGGKVMNFGKSKARMQAAGDKKVTFKDVAGVDEAKEELQEIVDFLKDGKKYTAIGAKIPKGVLMFGYPGTGKTLLAKAVAGEAGVPFFSISGSDFVEMFVGVGASRVRDLFSEAKKNAPCIVFIDEIDAVGRQRGAGLGGGHDEREQTLNQLLVEMDGFEENSGIIVFAATNRPDILDPALLRPGRFDRQISVNPPDVVGREAILKVHATGKPIAADVDWKIVARRTPGFTGADLANLVNEAALLAVRRKRTSISMKELEDASERVIAGPEKKSRVMSNEEKKLTAYHEAGHAVAAYFTPTADPVHKISIIPRGRAGGYTLMLPEEDRNYVTKSRMEGEIVVLLGGRIAEEIILKDISTGAQNDLERASETVRKMITRYGMSKKIGPLVFGHTQEQVFLGRDFNQDKGYSEEVAAEIDREARVMIDAAYKACTDLLTEHIDKLHAVAKVLFEKETVSSDEFMAIMNDAETYFAQHQAEQSGSSATVETVAVEGTETPESAPVIDGDNELRESSVVDDLQKSLNIDIPEFKISEEENK